MIELHMTNGDVVHLKDGTTFEDAMSAISRTPVFWQVGDKCAVRTDDISTVVEVDDDEQHD